MAPCERRVMPTDVFNGVGKRPAREPVRIHAVARIQVEPSLSRQDILVKPVHENLPVRSRVVSQASTSFVKNMNA